MPSKVIVIVSRLRVVPISPQGFWSERNASARENHPTRERRDAVGREKTFSLFAASRLGCFSRALAFRSLYCPWGKIGTTCRLFLLSPSHQKSHLSKILFTGGALGFFFLSYLLVFLFLAPSSFLFSFLFSKKASFNFSHLKFSWKFEDPKIMSG